MIIQPEIVLLINSPQIMQHVENVVIILFQHHVLYDNRLVSLLLLLLPTTATTRAASAGPQYGSYGFSLMSLVKELKL